MNNVFNQNDTKISQVFFILYHIGNTDILCQLLISNRLHFVISLIYRALVALAEFSIYPDKAFKYCGNGALSLPQ